MGIFNFLKSLGSKEDYNSKPSIQTDSIKSILTITPEKETFECYTEVFRKMITGISGLKESEHQEIYSIINKCDGGFLNTSGYHSVIWDTFFKNRTWHWKEYEEWNNIFSKLGRFPARFPIRVNYSEKNTEEILNHLKVNELKSILTEKDIASPPKAKKTDLINTLKTVPDIINTPIVSSKISELNTQFEYTLYSLFMRTIDFRSKSLHDIRRAEKLGVKKFRISYVFEEDKEFVEMAIRQNPNALHPVFPSDMSMKQPVIDF